jgi:hypothetical protein
MFWEPGNPWKLQDGSEEADRTVRLSSSDSLLDSLRQAWSAREWLTPLLIFIVSLGIFCGFAAERLPKQSADPHFVYLANTFNSMIAASLGDEEAVKRRESREPFELERKPPHRNDWASYWDITLRSGENIRGIWLDKQGDGRFKLLGKDQAMVIRPKEMSGAKRKRRYFVSFPPGPAVLMMPLAAIWDYDVNDVVFTVLFAALNVMLMFLLLRRLARGGRTGRGRRETLWLTALFGFGTVHLWCAVLGQVWFTALIVGVTFTLLYMLCSIDTRHPLLAGCFLAMAFATRTPLLFSCVFFYGFLLFPGGKLRRDNWGEFVKKGVLFSVPCLVVGLSLLWMNHVRFESFTEFGHTFLAGGTLDRIQNYGLFNFHFLSKNLSALLTLVPRLQPEAPFIIVSKHGMSILLTTPAFIWLAWPKPRENWRDVFWHRLLWFTVLVTAAPALLYQNTGFEQFGYRFSLDYTPYLVTLLAVGRRPLSKWFKAATIFGIGVNAFGAVTFKRFGKFFTNQFFP